MRLVGFTTACWLTVAVLGWAASANPVAGEATLSAGAPVAVTGGQVSGVVAESNSDIITFKGIAYAAPPIGDRRWKPPAPVIPWVGVRDAREYGAACIQGTQAGPYSEDCLFLNVWAPSETADPLPVMVWIHGGAFTSGSGAGALYDGTRLASRGVVLVTINYRLNVFGFYAHPALSAESGHGASGNYGLLDAVAALGWVRDNIAAFGGDPSRVTIFGESAGAGMVMSLMLVPAAEGLFHGAIAQSNYIPGWDRPLAEPARGWEPAEVQGMRVARALGTTGRGADALHALRAASAEAVFKASSTGGSNVFRREGNVWAPNVDGWVIPDDPLLLYRNGHQHDVPLIAGMNGNEGALFTRALGIGDADAFEAHVREVYPSQVDIALAHYGVTTDAEANAGIDHLVRDLFFAGPVLTHVASHARVASPAWLYHFTHVPPTPGGQGMGSHHAAELAYVFGNLELTGSDGSATEQYLATIVSGGYTDTDRRLSDTIMRYWVGFATTGDPNGDGLPVWHAHGPETDAHLELGEGIAPGRALHRAGAELFDAFEMSLRGR